MMPVSDDDRAAMAAYRAHERRAIDGRARLRRRYVRYGYPALAVWVIVVGAYLFGLVPASWWAVGGFVALAWTGFLVLGALHEERRYPWPAAPSLGALHKPDSAPQDDAPA